MSAFGFFGGRTEVTCAASIARAAFIVAMLTVPQVAVIAPVGVASAGTAVTAEASRAAAPMPRKRNRLARRAGIAISSLGPAVLGSFRLLRSIFASATWLICHRS